MFAISCRKTSSVDGIPTLTVVARSLWRGSRLVGQSATVPQESLTDVGGRVVEIPNDALSEFGLRFAPEVTPRLSDVDGGQAVSARTAAVMRSPLLSGVGIRELDVGLRPDRDRRSQQPCMAPASTTP